MLRFDRLCFVRGRVRMSAGEKVHTSSFDHNAVLTPCHALPQRNCFATPTLLNTLQMCVLVILEVADTKFRNPLNTKGHNCLPDLLCGQKELVCFRLSVSTVLDDSCVIMSLYRTVARYRRIRTRKRIARFILVSAAEWRRYY